MIRGRADFPFEAARKLLMVGNCDFVPHVLAANLDAYQQFQIKHLGRTRGVRNLETEVPMQKIKLTTELPI